MVSKARYGLTAPAPKPMSSARWADLARLARLDDDARAHARAVANEVVVHRRGREQAREWRA